ncbi:alpha/beta hydrolase [Carboxylicivirga sp. RSCT41]|uniref:alpha/beta hydrolase n=1 Tax=Carboxylicivirga agarovorans TaxID=3417570 RepID=UPI003D34FE77
MKTLIFNILIAVSTLTYAQKHHDKQAVQLSTPSGILCGTLLVADSINTTHVAIIIPGSGATDQNGNSGMAMHTNAYKLLAEELARNKISSLRFDKRGIGKSSNAAIQISELRFENFIDDVTLWTNMLKSDQRFKKVYLIGHSQGSLIGIMTAQASTVDGFISIAGAGYSIDKILNKQLKNKVSEELYKESTTILASLRKGEAVDSVSPWLYSVFSPLMQPYLISWIQYDPCSEIKKLDIPSLIINGTTDIQVSVDNAEKLHEAAKNSQLLIIDNMNHVLKEAPLEQKSNIATYSNGKLPVVPLLVEGIVDFIGN